MTDITVTAWERDGLHRGYANAPDGTALGWIDVATCEVSVDAPAAHIEAAAAALRSWARNARGAFEDGSASLSRHDPHAQP